LAIAYASIPTFRFIMDILRIHAMAIHIQNIPKNTLKNTTGRIITNAGNPESEELLLQFEEYWQYPDLQQE